MKTLIYKLIFPFLFLNITYFNYSQNYWSQLNGPYGGEVINIQKNSAGDLFALRDEGLYISSNNAESWTQLPEVLDNNNLCMDISPSGIIYVGKSSGGIWWTANNGQSWNFNPVNVAPHSGLWASIIISKVSPAGHIYINSYVSFNGGTTFNRIAIGSPEKLPADYAFNGSQVYAATNNGVYASGNNGSSWTIINGNLPALNASSLMTDNNILVAGINGSGVYRTSNNGSSWEPINNGISDLAVSRIYRDAQNNYFAGTANGKVFKSVNAGSSWTEIYTSENGNNINTITSDAGILYISTKNYGVLKSNNNGVTWNEKNHNLFLNGLTSLAFSNAGEIFAAGYSGIQYSSDNGLNWQNRINGLPSNIVQSVYFTQDQNLLAGIHIFGIYRSSDKGISWSPSSNGISNNSSIKEIKSSSGILYAAHMPNLFVDTLEIYKSSDNGFNWTEILQPQSPGMGQFTIDAQGNLYVAGFNSAFGQSLLSSTDGGNTWNENTLSQFFDLQNLTASGQNIYITSGLNIHYSSNKGVTWNVITNGNWPNSGFTTIGVNRLGHIFASVGNKVFLTTNTGTSWSQKNSGITQGSYINNFIFNDGGFVFGISYYNGIFKSVQSTLTQTNNYISNVPKRFSLGPNYPNPFNPSTIISYEIPSIVNRESSIVKLVIYNSAGMEIKTLVNDKQNAGSYEIEFDGSNFPSGIYFYQIRADNFIEVRKMMLVK